MEPYRFGITDELLTILERLRSQNDIGSDDPDFWIALSLEEDAAFLTRDGRIIIYDGMSEEGREVYEEQDACRWLHYAVDEQNIPDLLCLLPPRPRFAQDCDFCRGVGREQEIDTICYHCGGLGWIRANEEGRR